MKKDWNSPRSRQQVEAQIPAEYQAHNPQTQERREMTLLLQEAAFSDHIPIYCAIDLTQLLEEERVLFESEVSFAPQGAIILGQTIHEMFLYAEQDIPGVHGNRTVTAAQLIVENYLMDYREKLEIQGYQAEILHPSAIPSPKLASMMASSGKGFAGKNGRFIAGTYGCQVSVGILVTDAPIMGGDYRFPDVQASENPCKECTACIDACPAGALSESGFDAIKCVEYRDNPTYWKEAGPHTRIKCMACMTACSHRAGGHTKEQAGIR